MLGWFKHHKLPRYYAVCPACLSTLAVHPILGALVPCDQASTDRAEQRLIELCGDLMVEIGSQTEQLQEQVRNG